MSEPLKLYQTAVYPSPEGVKIRYYKTIIVTFTSTEIILDTGGWWTATTRKRMNQVSRHFRLGYRVRISGKQWYVQYQGENHFFAEKPMRLDRKTGQVAVCS